MNEKVTPSKDGGFLHEVEHDGQRMTIALSAADIERIITAAVRTAKEPDEATKKKMDDEEARRKQAIQNMIAEAMQNEAAVASRQSRCSHRKPDQETAVHGQIHSDGKIHPICIICQKLFAAYDAPREMVTGMGF